MAPAPYISIANSLGHRAPVGVTQMSRIIVKLASAFGAVLLAGLSTATAQEIACGPHDTVALLLNRNYSETVESIGLTTGGSLLEIYVSPAGTWTAVLTTPNGPSCLVEAGTNWRTGPKPPEA